MPTVTPSANPFAVIVADVQKVIAAIKAGLVWFAKEFDAAIAWVDKNVPGAQAALATFFQAAETAAVDLEQHSSAGLQDLVATAVDDGGAMFLKVLEGLGVDLTNPVLQAADVAAINAATTIAQNAIQVAAGKVIGGTAAIATQVQSANTAAPAPVAGVTITAAQPIAD